MSASPQGLNQKERRLRSRLAVAVRLVNTPQRYVPSRRLETTPRLCDESSCCDTQHDIGRCDFDPGCAVALEIVLAGLIVAVQAQFLLSYR